VIPRKETAGITKSGKPESLLLGFETVGRRFRDWAKYILQVATENMLGKLVDEGPIEGIYFALSEVVAIMPADALVSRG